MTDAPAILLITTNFPRWEGDPHSPWLVHLLQRLQQSGARIDVLAPAHKGIGNQRIHGMEVTRFRYAPSAWETLTHEEGAPSKIRRNPLYLFLLPLYMVAGLLAALRMARRRRYDVIHVHWPVPQGLFGVVARWAARGRREAGPPRLVATFYGADLVLTERFALIRPFLRWFVARCDDCAAISTYTARTLRELSGRTPRVIPYGISLPAADVDWPTQPGELLYVGRLIARKGVKYLIQAVEKLPQARLTIVGAGPEKEKLIDLTRRLGVADRVAFLGRVSDEELEICYQRCDLFVLPAIVDETGDTEMLGMVLLEAMRYRRPVVASNVGGIPDIVCDGVNGLLVPQKDPDGLAAKLARLLSDRELSNTIGARGYTYARDHFGWDAVEQATLALYGRAAATPTKAGAAGSPLKRA